MKARWRGRLLGFALPLAWFGCPTWATARAERTPEEQSGGRVDPPGYRTVVRGKLRLHSGTPDDPAALSTRIQLDSPPPGSQLSDLLRRVPGLRVLDYGPGQTKTFSTRAAESHQVVVLLDGIRLTAPGRGAVDLSLIDPFQLEALEVRRSAGSTRFGSGTLGGSLALSTRRLANRRQLAASVGYGAWNTVSTRLAHADKRGDLRYLVSGTYRRGEGDFAFVNNNGQTWRRLNNDASGGDLLLKLDHPLGERWQLSLLNHFGGTERGAPGPSMRPSITARQRDLRNLTALQATRFGLIQPSGRVRLAAYHRYGRFGFEDPDPPKPARAVSVETDTFNAGAQASLVLPLSKAVRLDGGVELDQRWQRDVRTENRQRFSADAYASAQIRLWNARLAIVPALRLLTATGFSGALAPKLGLVVRPFPVRQPVLGALELVANVGRSYRVPSFEELYLQVEGFQPNPQLQPEDAWTVDAGLRWRADALLSLEVVYFRRWLSNTILYAPSGSFFVRPNNYSDARAHGVESAIETQPGLCLGATLSYAFSWTEFSQLSLPGQSASLGSLQLPGHPQHQLTARLEWSGDKCPQKIWRRSPPAGVGAAGSAEPDDSAETGDSADQRPKPWWLLFRGLALRAEVNAQSSMFLDRLNSDTVAEEQRLLLSLGGSYTYRFATVDLTLNNLLDKRDAVDTLGFPLAPLSFFVSTTLTW